MIVLKVSFDERTGELVRQVRTDNGATLRVFGELDLEAQQIYSLALYGRDLIVDRVQSGIGSDDQPFPPLARGYGIQKTKAGKGNRRDLTFTGSMLDGLQVRSISSNQARISITRSLDRIKARANEQKSPWWGWSPSDVQKLSDAGGDVFSEVVAGVLPIDGRGSATRLKAVRSEFIPRSIRPTARLAA